MISIWLGPKFLLFGKGLMNSALENKRHVKVKVADQKLSMVFMVIFVCEIIENMLEGEKFSSSGSIQHGIINSLADNKILDWSKLKQIADYILKCM